MCHTNNAFAFIKGKDNKDISLSFSINRQGQERYTVHCTL